jgi:hypothetical protein
MYMGTVRVADVLSGCGAEGSGVCGRFGCMAGRRYI